MQLSPYLAFNGNCAEAFRFYADVLGGRIAMMMTNGDSPIADQMPPESRDRVMHVRMEFGGNVLMGGDAPPDHFQQPQGFSVSLQLDAAATGERIFNALAERGTVKMPFQETFWAKGFGMCIDRFGTPWMVNCGNKKP